MHNSGRKAEKFTGGWQGRREYAIWGLHRDYTPLFLLTLKLYVHIYIDTCILPCSLTTSKAGLDTFRQAFKALFAGDEPRRSELLLNLV